MNWKTIRLELARTEEYPQGSPRHVYILHLPLLPDDLIDEPALRQQPDRATAHRYWENERTRSGYVIKTPRSWVLSYERGEDDDEVLFHLETHPLRPGEYLTIIDSEEEHLPMFVASVQELEDPSESKAQSGSPEVS
jgi:hypothetical protein